MFKLTPSKTRFFDLFDQATTVLVESTVHFEAGLKSLSDAHKLAEEMHNLEHKGDDVTHATFELLHTSFITPLERADIRRLVTTLDDVLDALEDASRRLALYEITQALPSALQLAAVLVRASKVVQLCVAGLRNLRSRHDILRNCIECHRLEDEGDHIYHQALSTLFKSNMNPLDVIKWKDIIEDLERAIDGCQDVANVVEGILLENA